MGYNWYSKYEELNKLNDTIVNITIIIPVYNAGKYLQDCLGSVSNQTLSSIEIIVVNDGSTDNSINIIRDFQLQDHRIKLIDGPNKGVSNARNMGLTAATGDYIGFVDADDWIEPDMFERLLAAIINDETDLAICNIKLHDRINQICDRLIVTDEIINIRTRGELFLKNLMDFKFDYSNWNKLYRREIILNNNIIFFPGIKIWEDLLFNLNYIHFVNKISVLNKSLYHYRIHDDSVMNKSEDELIEQYNILFETYRAFCMENNFTDSFTVFNYKMAQGVYNNLFPRFANNINKNFSFFTGLNLKSVLLLKFNPDIFLFKNSELKGYQGFKKRLLMKRNYTLFSFLDSIRKSIFS